MEANKMMREWMVLTTLVMTACGSVTQENDAVVPIEDDEPAEMMDAGVPPDSGEGSGSDDEVEEVEEEEEEEEVAPIGTIAFAPSPDFIVDGARWWTSTSGPALSGTFTGPTVGLVHVSNGSGSPLTAAVQGSAWSLQLPSGYIASDDTTITVRLSDASGQFVEAQQVFVFDAAGPMVTLQPSKVRDERGDVIDFSKDEPFHTHAGAEIDLGGAGCPAVYKYAYLMDAAIPFGVSVTPNPLAWKLELADMKLATTGHSFRVRALDGQILRDWTALPAPDAQGIYTIELTRKGGAFPVAALGTRTGQIYLDVKARDWSNNETIKSVCWTHHPLQAPVAVSPSQRGSLWAINLPANTPAAALLNNGGVELVSQVIANQTSEPTTVTWTASPTAMTYSVATFDGFVTEEKTEQVYCLNGTTDARCNTTWSAPSAGYQTGSGSFAPTTFVDVIDTATNQVVAMGEATSVTFTLPARAASGAARAYRFVLTTGAMTALRPVALGAASYGEHSLQGLYYTGVAAQSAGVHCVSMTNTQWGPMCNRVAYHTRFSALDRATLAFSVGFKVEQGGVAAPYVPTTAKTTGALAWDSGDDDLPGTY